MKYKIEATIPTTQYGNIRPTFELETQEEEVEAFEGLKRLWTRFGETPLKDKGQAIGTTETKGEEIITFTGEHILWYNDKHIYTDMDGNVLLSGSKYADMHSPKFDMQAILPKTAKSWEVDEESLKKIWANNSEISTLWGSAVHNALEQYHLFGKIGEKIQEAKKLEFNYILPKNDYIRSLVLKFVDKFGFNALPEVLVSDIKNKMAGTIDRLEIIDEAKKVCRIGDYKTNAEMDAKKLLKYQKQLSYYAHVLKNHGWTVEGLDLFFIVDDEWVLETMAVLDLE